MRHDKYIFYDCNHGNLILACMQFSVISRGSRMENIVQESLNFDVVKFCIEAVWLNKL